LTRCIKSTKSKGKPLDPKTTLKKEGETKVKERLEQLNHLAEVLYNESRNLYTVSKGKAQIYQIIIDDMQEQLDEIMNEILRAEQNQ